jgi:exosortase E/protease (VPEID-CTERM system)
MQPESAADLKGRQQVLRRLVLASAVLVLEYLIISVAFDAETLRTLSGWEAIGRIGALAPLGLAVVTAMFLLRGAPELSLPAEVPAPTIRHGLIALHGLSYLAFFFLTQRIFGGGAASIRHPVLWFALWTAVGGTSALLLLVGLLGVRVLRTGMASGTVLAGAGVGVAAWLAGGFTTTFWRPLSLATLSVVSALLRPFFPDVEANPEDVSLRLRDFEITIAPECSGLEGVGLIAVMIVGYLIAFRKTLRFPAAFALLPLAIATVWIGNALRMSGLMLLGAFGDPELALGGFHSKAGWAFFCVIALGFAVLGRRARLFAREPEVPGTITDNPTAGYLMPVLGLIAGALVTGMFTRAVDTWYVLRIGLAVGLLVAFRRYYRDLSFGFSPIAMGVGLLVGAVWIATAPVNQDAVLLVSETFEGKSRGFYWSWLATRVVGSCLVVPVCEELAFRGYLLRRLIDRDFTSVSFMKWSPIAIVGSSLAFGLVHERWVAAALAGLAYALVQLRSGRLADAVVAHSASNVVIAVWVLAKDAWWLWQ